MLRKYGILVAILFGLFLVMVWDIETGLGPNADRIPARIKGVGPHETMHSIVMNPEVQKAMTEQAQAMAQTGQ